MSSRFRNFLSRARVPVEVDNILELGRARERFELPKFELFRNELRSCRNYGEFGVGASTVYVDSVVDCRISAVESDPHWARAVALRLPSHSIRWVNLGPVGKRGRPRSMKYAKRFPLYYGGVFEGGFDPDLVLIDGRFRVSCFLTTLLKASEGTRIIFDDYPYRSNYFVAEDVLKPEVVSERQALFVKPRNLAHEKILRLLERYASVMD